jgi:tetratricopeptide (TPR) repeat protein
MRNRVLLLLMLLAFSCAAMAQGVRVKGTVKNAQGQPIENAEVLLQGGKEEGNLKFKLKTNKKGDFFSLGIRPGPYALTVSKDGNTIAQQQVAVDFDDTKNVYDVTAGAPPAAPTAAQQQEAPTGAAAPQGEAQGKQATESITLDPNKPVTLTEEQLKKLNPEQKKQYEEYQKVVSKNQQIKNVNTVLAQARQASEAGNPEQAAQILAPVAQANNEFALPWILLGSYQADAAKKVTDSAQKQQAYDQAAASIQKGIQIAETGSNPREKAEIPKWRLNYGTVLERARKHDDAIKAFEQVAQEAGTTDPKTAAIGNFNAGVAATNAGKSDQAVGYFDKAIAADPTYADAYYQKGIALVGKATTDKSGKIVAPEGTEQAFEKYLELAPTGPNAQAAKDMLTSIGSKAAMGYKKK